MDTNLINATGYTTYSKGSVVGVVNQVRHVADVAIENSKVTLKVTQNNTATVENDQQAQSRLINALMEHSLEMLESETKQAEARAEELKTLAECMKIAAKLSKGEASFEEIRYLQKHGIEMYSMAMALRDPKTDDSEDNETTTNIKDEDGSPVAQNQSVSALQSAVAQFSVE